MYVGKGVGMKKLLNIVYVMIEGSVLKKDGENLVVEVEGVEKVCVFLYMFVLIVIFGLILLLLVLIGICVECGILVVFFDWVSWFQVWVEGVVLGNVLLCCV